MKAGKTLMELAAEVQRQSTAKADYVAVAGALKMVESAKTEGRGQ